MAAKKRAPGAPTCDLLLLAGMSALLLACASRPPDVAPTPTIAPPPVPSSDPADSGADASPVAVDAAPEAAAVACVDDGSLEVRTNSPPSPPVQSQECLHPKPHAPRLRDECGNVAVSGYIKTAVITKIVNENFGRFNLCYEASKQTPRPTGIVRVRLTIDRSGAVADARDGGTCFPDPAVVACVIRGFTNLSFPQPEGGIVGVVYPLKLGPAAK